jgi:hypothetical protein
MKSSNTLPQGIWESCSIKSIAYHTPHNFRMRAGEKQMWDIFLTTTKGAQLRALPLPFFKLSRVRIAFLKTCHKKILIVRGKRLPNPLTIGPS